MKTSIIILTLNNSDLTKLCIESIRKHTKEHYELIIVDNGSTDDTVGYLKKQSDIQAIYNHQNAGFAKGCNQGAAIATGDNLLFLNNDTIVTENWLTNMLKVLYSNELIGIVGPVSNKCSGRQQVRASYPDFSEGLENFARERCKKYSGVTRYSSRLIGFCLLIKKHVWDEVGPFDEQFGMGNFEDDDLCLRVLEAGYMSMIVKDSFIHHFDHSTFQSLKVNYAFLLKQNRKKAQEKWGADINYLLDKPQKSISLCMVVYNDEGTIKNCLESVKGIVNEIIIVDTGSTDRTKEIASQYTNRIFDFTSKHQLVDARNLSFSQATMDYILWLEPNDVLYLEERKKLFKLKRSIDPAFESISMIYIRRIDRKSNPNNSIRRNNLIKRNKQIQWVGTENVELVVEGPIYDSDITVTQV